MGGITDNTPDASFFFSVVRRRELFRSLRYNRQIPLFPQGE